MLVVDMRYEGTVYRPPSEAGSLIIQATIGCPHNKCAFCGMYRSIPYRERSVAEITNDLDQAAESFGPELRSIFLADGNCAALPTATLVAVAEAAKQRFPKLERITSYGSPKYLIAKSRNEWQAIAEAGVTQIHSGLETGDPQTLEMLQKAVTPEQAAAGFNLVVSAGIELSVYLMVGVAGHERWREHAEGSAAVINQVERLDSLRLRTFVPVIGTEWHDHWKEGNLTLLTAHQAIAETRLLVERLQGPTTILSDHLSNFVDINGSIPDDKPDMLGVLDEALTWPVSAFRPPTESLIGIRL
jgi:radical SAM superfamily enzyme YgiQ (UPF0313 family)